MPPYATVYTGIRNVPGLTTSSAPVKVGRMTHVPLPSSHLSVPPLFSDPILQPHRTAMVQIVELESSPPTSITTASPSPTPRDPDLVSLQEEITRLKAAIDATSTTRTPGLDHRPPSETIDVNHAAGLAPLDPLRSISPTSTKKEDETTWSLSPDAAVAPTTLNYTYVSYR